MSLTKKCMRPKLGRDMLSLLISDSINTTNLEFEFRLDPGRLL